MHSKFLFAALIFLAAAAEAKQFMIDCGKYPGPCNNDCYAVFTAGKDQKLHRDANGNSGKKRGKAGCFTDKNRNPCKNGKMDRPDKDHDSCDEYPFAATKEGGDNAILRCTEPGQNQGEGGQLGRWFVKHCKDEPECEFEVMFINAEKAKYCHGDEKGGKNDGFEYVYEGDQKYKLQGTKFRRASSPGWKLHEPDPNSFFPAHRRREFLLETGDTTMLLSRDEHKMFDGASVHYEDNNGTMLETRIVRELQGDEKSPMFRF